MPKLPDKFDLGGIPGGGGRAPALISDMPTGGDFLVGDAIAKGVNKVALAVQAKQEEADDYEVQKRIVDFDLEQEKRLDDIKHNAPPEAKGVTQSYRASYDAAATDLMKRIPERMKDKVDTILVKRGAQFEKRAYDFELAERDRWNVQDVNTRTSELVTHTMGSPDALEDNAQRGVALIRSSKLPARAKIDTEKKFLDMNAEYGIKGMIDREIEAGRDAGDLIERLRKVPKGSIGRGAAVDLSQPIRVGDDGAIDPVEFTARMRDKVAGSKLVGTAPAWAKKFGIETGSPDEWARFFAMVQQQESGHKVAQRNPDGSLKRFATTPAGERSFGPGQFNVGEYGLETWDDVNNPDKVMDAYIKVAEAGKVPAYFGSVQRPRETLQHRRWFDETVAPKLPEKVERTDLPAPRDATGAGTKEAAGPSVDQDGRPVLTKSDSSGGTTEGRATLTKDGGDGAPSDELQEADDAGWTYLSPGTRRKLINYARTAGRAVVTKGVDDDIARLRLGREPEAGPDGKTSLDRARAHMTNLQWTRKKQEWDEATLEHKELSGLRTMTAEEAADHVATMIDRAEGNEDSVRAAARVQKKADQRLAKIRAMRDSDPVRSVNGFDGDEPDDRSPPLPNTREAMKKISQGRQAEIVTGPDGVPVRAGTAKPAMTPQQQWATLFEARLADQSEVMPYETEKHRIISKREAEQLLRMPRDGKGLDHRAYRDRLEEAARTAEAKFGPKYARRALEEAIGFHLAGGSADHKQRQSSILAKMARGEPISSRDITTLRDIETIEGTSLSLGIDTMARIDRAGRSQGMPTIVPTAESGRPAIGQGMPQPTPKQIDWIKANPDGWQAFDQRFGQGAASRALGLSGGDAWGASRGKIPKREFRDDENSMKPSAGWSGFFGR